MRAGGPPLMMSVCTIPTEGGGWPGFPCFPFLFRDSGCPVLAFFARAGTMLLVPWGLLCPAACIGLTALITCTLSLPRATGDCLFCAPRAAAMPSYDSGTGSRALSVCSRRVCRDAGTHSPAFDGTGSWGALDGDAGGEAAHGPRRDQRPGPTADGPMLSDGYCVASLLGQPRRLSLHGLGRCMRTAGSSPACGALRNDKVLRDRRR
jgi:hypothetical protein